MTYSVACNNCHNEYIGETSRNLNKRLYKNEIFYTSNTSNTSVAHCNEAGHNFDLKNAGLIKRENSLLGRKCIESVQIANLYKINLGSGSYNI